jgi:hypothetical protein
VTTLFKRAPQYFDRFVVESRGKLFELLTCPRLLQALISQLLQTRVSLVPVSNSAIRTNSLTIAPGLQTQ